MVKKFNYIVCLILFLSFITLILFGSLLRHHYLGGDKFKSLQKIAVLLAELPSNLKLIVKKGSLNINKLDPLLKHKSKKRFEKFSEKKRNALLVLPRYDHSILRSVVDIVDLNNFEIIHTYKHDIKEMINLVKNDHEFLDLKIDNSPTRFQYRHPLIFDDGSMIGNLPIYKIDFCSKLKWINADESFHHSLEIDHEGNIWVGGTMKPSSKFIYENLEKNLIKNFADDAIFNVSNEGKILFRKSIIELLIDNNLIDKNILFTGNDPIHINDIEPAFNDTEYWKKGDVFISIRHKSAIIHYRPSTNKVINYITGPFAQQHDVDIISNKEITIFDNNNSFVNNEYSKVLIYDLEKKEFSNFFGNQLEKENFKTETQGLSHVFKDGSLLVEEQNHGRIILINNRGEKEWEFVNKDKNGDIGFVSWSRVIEDEIFIENFKSIVKNTSCLK